MSVRGLFPDPGPHVDDEIAQGSGSAPHGSTHLHHPSLNRRACLVVAIIGLLSVATAVAQDTTGRLLVRTTTSDGKPLDGVTVAIESPALIGGVRTVVTDRLGEARHPSLVPGVYTVSAALDGFVTQNRGNVRVSLGGTTLVAVEMVEASFAGEVKVLADTPTVDPSQVAAEQVFGRE